MERWDILSTLDFVKPLGFYENYSRGHTYGLVIISLLSLYGTRIKTKSNNEGPLIAALETLG